MEQGFDPATTKCRGLRRPLDLQDYHNWTTRRIITEGRRQAALLPKEEVEVVPSSLAWNLFNGILEFADRFKNVDVT